MYRKVFVAIVAIGLAMLSTVTPASAGKFATAVCTSSSTVVDFVHGTSQIDSTWTLSGGGTQTAISIVKGGGKLTLTTPANADSYRAILHTTSGEMQRTSPCSS